MTKNYQTGLEGYLTDDDRKTACSHHLRSVAPSMAYLPGGASYEHGSREAVLSFGGPTAGKIRVIERPSFDQVVCSRVLNLHQRCFSLRLK